MESNSVNRHCLPDMSILIGQKFSTGKCLNLKIQMRYFASFSYYMIHTRKQREKMKNGALNASGQKNEINDPRPMRLSPLACTQKLKITFLTIIPLHILGVVLINLKLKIVESIVGEIWHVAAWISLVYYFGYHMPRP